MIDVKRFLCLIVVLATVCQSCTNIDDDIDNNARTILTMFLPKATRTYLGDKADNKYPTYWSAGDRTVANGIASQTITIGDNRASATFEFPSSGLSKPYNITYPYSEGSLCTKDRPTVVFPSEQNFIEGTFGIGDAPMYSYCEESRVTMNHLACILRFAIKGAINLAKIEIITNENIAIAGEFDVNCKTGEISAIEGRTTNKITYAVNKSFEPYTINYLHIAIPHGNFGECQVVITNDKGAEMKMKFDGSNIKRGFIREFKPFEFKIGASFELEDLEVITDDDLIIPGETEGICGYVRYHDDTPASGVSVSDGFSVVITDDEGFYRFENGVDSRTKYIYISMPAKAKVLNNANNHIDFFQSYKTTKERYDFTLTKMAKESEFSLFVIADTHGARETYITRVETECVGGIRREGDRKDVPCYTIILGDIVCASATTSAEEYNQPRYMDVMREKFAMSNTAGVPTFYVMGNHDHDKVHFDLPQYSDLDTFNYHVQDAFEAHFGPANYSFNRGDTHIVCMRNILWPESCLESKNSEGCFCGFTDEQVEWLRQDLENVPKSNKVILCVHIPLVENYEKQNSVKSVVDMISKYNEPQIFSGHTHANRDFKAGSSNYSYTSPVSEKTIVGNWGCGSAKTANGFSEKCMGDGSPFGFDVYDIKGNAFTDHYFVDCTSNKSHKVDTDYVMRTYLSSDVYGGDCNGDGKVYTNSKHTSHQRYFRFYSSKAYDNNNNLRYDTYLHVNIFNGTPDTWTVKLYINNSYVKDLVWHASGRNGAWNDCSPEAFTWRGNGSGTLDDPWWPSTNSTNSQDWWQIAYIINETGSTNSQTTNALCHHKWRCFVPSSNLEDVKAGNFYIEATHTEFGVTKVYRSNKIFGQNDYNGYMNYNN